MHLSGWQSLRRWRERAFEAWLNRRIPADSSPVVLHRRRVYILPTRLGWIFAGTVTALLIGSLNYEASLGFAATFFLVGIGIAGMIRTYRNLQDLQLRFSAASPVFAGEPARFPISLETPDISRWAIRINGTSVPAALPGEPASTHVSIRTTRRGRLYLPRLSVDTLWPLGLFRVWSWLRPTSETIVYPRSVDHGRHPTMEGVVGQQGPASRTDEEDFAGLREYRAGDSPRRIAWKSFARSDELHTKTFEAQRADDRWFDWHALTDLAPEQRLEQMTCWVVNAHACGDRYGLTLPETAIEAASGPEHRARCLEALALHGLGDRP